ncbi:hypothetical protein L218DRAFT_716881 [Marasmius fiardii PR-910]|nr:hypothetical protein L218DRAFT_716881 [Marasmius fiardii PR-910]
MSFSFSSGYPVARPELMIQARVIGNQVVKREHKCVVLLLLFQISSFRFLVFEIRFRLLPDVTFRVSFFSFPCSNSVWVFLSFFTSSLLTQRLY